MSTLPRQSGLNTHTTYEVYRNESAHAATPAPDIGSAGYVVSDVDVNANRSVSMELALAFKQHHQHHTSRGGFVARDNNVNVDGNVERGVNDDPNANANANANAKQNGLGIGVGIGIGIGIGIVTAFEIAIASNIGI